MAEGRLDDVLLVGRDEGRLADVADANGGLRYTTDLDKAVSDPAIDVFLDATGPMTRARFAGSFLAAGKHVLTEKPTGLTARKALEMVRVARDAGVNAAMVQDKLFTPGFDALRRAVTDGKIGSYYTVTGEFGYWVDDGLAPGTTGQRPSWNYRSRDGGSLSSDLFTHWSYLLELVGQPVQVRAISSMHIPRRRDEQGDIYACDLPDTLYVSGLLAGGVSFDIRSSWVMRPFRPFTLTVHGSLATVSASPTRAVVYSASGAMHEDGLDLAVRAPTDEFRALWADFLDAIEQRPGDVSSLESGYRAAVLCEAIDESASCGTAIDVSRAREES